MSFLKQLPINLKTKYLQEIITAFTEANPGQKIDCRYFYAYMQNDAYMQNSEKTLKSSPDFPISSPNFCISSPDFPTTVKIQDIDYIPIYPGIIDQVNANAMLIKGNHIPITPEIFYDLAKIQSKSNNYPTHSKETIPDNLVQSQKIIPDDLVQSQKIIPDDLVQSQKIIPDDLARTQSITTITNNKPAILVKVTSAQEEILSEKIEQFFITLYSGLQDIEYKFKNGMLQEQNNLVIADIISRLQELNSYLDLLAKINDGANIRLEPSHKFTNPCFIAHFNQILIAHFIEVYSIILEIKQKQLPIYDIEEFHLVQHILTENICITKRNISTLLVYLKGLLDFVCYMPITTNNENSVHITINNENSVHITTNNENSVHITTNDENSAHIATDNNREFVLPIAFSFSQTLEEHLETTRWQQDRSLIINQDQQNTSSILTQRQRDNSPASSQETTTSEYFTVASSQEHQTYSYLGTNSESSFSTLDPHPKKHIRNRLNWQ